MGPLIIPSPEWDFFSPQLQRGEWTTPFCLPFSVVSSLNVTPSQFWESIDDKLEGGFNFVPISAPHLPQGYRMLLTAPENRKFAIDRLFSHRWFVAKGAAGWFNWGPGLGLRDNHRNMFQTVEAEMWELESESYRLTVYTATEQGWKIKSDLVDEPGARIPAKIQAVMNG